VGFSKLKRTEIKVLLKYDSIFQILDLQKQY